jgi:hypothetical protein
MSGLDIAFTVVFAVLFTISLAVVVVCIDRDGRFW